MLNGNEVNRLARTLQDRRRHWLLRERQDCDRECVRVSAVRNRLPQVGQRSTAFGDEAWTAKGRNKLIHSVAQEALDVAGSRRGGTDRCPHSRDRSRPDLVEGEDVPPVPAGVFERPDDQQRHGGPGDSSQPLQRQGVDDAGPECVQEVEDVERERELLWESAGTDAVWAEPPGESDSGRGFLLEGRWRAVHSGVWRTEESLLRGSFFQRIHASDPLFAFCSGVPHHRK